MDEKKAQRIEKLADGILNLVIGIDILSMLKVIPKLSEGAEKICTELSRRWYCEYDDRGNIGKRYRRQDEIGTPYCVTYDFDSEEDGCVTVRERDSMQQVRLPIASLPEYFEEKLSF